MIATDRLNITPTLREARRLSCHYDEVSLYSDIIVELETTFYTVLKLTG